MEEKIIEKLNDLSVTEIKYMALALRSGMYSILSTERRNLEGIIQHYITRDTYRYILDDTEADFKCFALAFPSGEMSVVVPMGVYGVTAARQIYFPLILNSIWLGFVTMSFDEFNRIRPTGINVDSRSKFAVLLEVREELIKSIFHYYYNLDDKFDSVMAWGARKPGSPTRKIAERMMFNRIERGDINGRSEMYSKKVFQGEEGYLIECISRWQTFSNEAQHVAGNKSLSIEKLSLFYQVLTG